MNFCMCLTAVLLGLLGTYADSAQKNTLESSDVKTHRQPKISSEFGYNILNSDRISNHFRQENRDVNGVVRGSYGFKNPNGIFRLVQYIADNRGFRAHISSNEHGVGNQNPAGVSINRFEHQDLVTEDKTKPPISDLRKMTTTRDRLEVGSDDDIPRYDYYLPINSRRPSENQYDRSSLYRDESNAYEYDLGRREFYSSHQQNPIDRLMKKRFNIPGENVPNLHEIDRHSPQRHDHSWISNPFIPRPADQLLTQNYIRNALYNPVNFPSVLSNEDKTDHSSHPDKNNFKMTFVNPQDYISDLYRGPLQEVHYSLPDCNSVSSAVLCKPPIYSGDTSQEIRNFENNRFLNNIRQTHTTQLFPSVDETRAKHSPHSQLALELSGDTQNMYPPHLVPNSYPLRSEIYKKFFSNLNGNSEREDKNCQKNIYGVETTSDDYITPLESHKFSDSFTTNDLSSYDQHTPDLTFTKNTEQKNTQHPLRQNELYSRLIRIIQNDESLNKLKHLLLQSSQKTTSNAESPKLSLLGVLILPSSVIKELDNDQHQREHSITKYNPEDFDIKMLTKKNFENITPDITSFLDDINKTYSAVNYDENDAYKSNTSLKGNRRPGNETNRFILDLPSQVQFSTDNLTQNVDYNSSNIEFPAETVTSPKLYVYDEQKLLDKEKNNKSHLSTDNWRKVLEDEISKEIRESSFHKDVPPLDSFLGESTNSDSNKNTHDNHNSFNKHIGPLYDSTGRLIQPENVPIHIHRFNPPSGLTSLPWKFSIPRPAPPRSIVVPPKPPILS